MATLDQRTLPSLDSNHFVTERQARHFRQKGHAIVRGLALPEEVAVYRPAIAKTLYEHTWETRPLEERDAKCKAFLQAENL
jgi:hypothetical protein